MGAFAGVLLAAVLSPVNTFPLPATADGVAVGGISGLARVTNDTYYAIVDKGRPRCLHRLTLGVDRTTGAVTNAAFAGSVTLAKGDDAEGVAWDAAAGWVWTADETDNAIRAFRPDGAFAAQVDMPKAFTRLVYNFGLESLALQPDGKVLWTCNEEALAGDGPRAGKDAGSWIRLQRFTRATPSAAWRPAGQWAYRTDGFGGKPFLDKSRSGVSDLLCLSDGTLLALERELSVKKGSAVPSFRCRIYEIDFNGATDVANVSSLARGTFTPVVKKRRFAANTGLAMYEGVCLGPTLADGSQSVLLISDGGDGAANRVRALKLTQ